MSTGKPSNGRTLLDLAGGAALAGLRALRPAPEGRPPPGRAARLRARFLLCFLLLGYGLLAHRLHTLQIVEHEHWASIARRQHTRLREVPPERGRILLRDGERRVPAVVSVERGSLLVEGRRGRDVEGFLSRLEGALPDLSSEERTRARARLSAGRSFYLRRRRLERAEMDALRAARLPRSAVEVEPIRAYSFGGLAAQVFGLVDADHRGSTGLEARLEERLRGTPGQREVQVDNLRRELALPGALVEPARPGHDLFLTIDRSLQAVVDAELERVGQEHTPLGAACVVVDPANGDVLAMGSWPSYRPDALEGDFREALRNRCISDTYEPGSTMKPLLIGTAWELGLGAPDRAIECPLRFKAPGRRKAIVDSHLVGSVQERDVIEQSSNTGAFKITARLSPAQIRRAIAGFGLGRRSGLPLPAEAGGNTRALRKLDPTTLGSVAQGYAVSVTPLQMALAYGALANGGTLFRPRLVAEVRARGGRGIERTEPLAVARPLSPATCRGGLREALVGVVNGKRGTARRARSKSYTFAGKTGTTKLLVDGRYHPREVVASFCGYAPAEAPRIAFSVVVWGPSTKKGRAWGSTAAAPCASRVAEQALRLLRVPPRPPEADSATK